MNDDAYSFNFKKFASEVFPDEIVVLDVIEGTYFSLGGAIPMVWPALIGGIPLLEIARVLGQTYKSPSDELQAPLQALVTLLSSEGILEPASPAVAARPVNLVARVGPSFPGFPVEKHEGIQSLLTIDPIRDVDPKAGWPRR